MDNVSTQSPNKYSPMIKALLMVLIVLISVFLILLNKYATTRNTAHTPKAAKATFKPITLPSPSPTPFFDSTYENPFNDQAQYQNPFSDNINPFDNL